MTYNTDHMGLTVILYQSFHSVFYMYVSLVTNPFNKRFTSSYNVCNHMNEKFINIWHMIIDDCLSNT